MAEVNKIVRNDMSDKIDVEEDFAAMFEESLKAEESTICDGVIVNIKDDEVFVDVRKKSEGVMNISEITDDGGSLLYNIGDTIKVAITGSRNGRPIVSHKKALRKEKVKTFIDNFDENAENIYDIKIISKNKGGFVAISEDGIEFFMPKSQSGFRDSNQVMNKTFKAKVLKVDKNDQSIIVSRKKLLDEDRRKRKEAIANIIDNTDIIEGTIKKITTYGMFVDVGGIDGLVHYSEISYKGPVNPNTLYKEGDKVDVKIIKYDNDKKHLSLSIKAATPDPWDEIKDGLEVGDTIKVIVRNIEPYGAFVDLGNDIEGFLHISEISWDKNIKNPKDFIKENEELDVEVIEIDVNERRLRVSLKNLLPKPFDEFSSKFKEGDIVKGVVTTLTNFGAFVRVGALEGLLHNEDSSWDRNDKCKDILKTGDEIDVKIIKIDDKNQKISLSQKDLKDSPVTQYAKVHSVGDIVTGTVRDIKDFGIFVSLEGNVDALIRKEDIGSLDPLTLKAGDKIEAAIAFIDEKKNRIRLSVKRLARQKEREVLNEINDDDKMTLGDIIKEQLA
ncbi:30S ribosomal protein S1 [Campylobacter fetus]|uniref:30S ribosomal protein S1 n=1 Tax=Campylobacter fetus TaxID=196 RepID=UPI0003E3766D|nr:30S ribosomal protein S1 [Campylobacter fetus]OCS26004.1 30S ribosomal protein S1 [Campylobacter fetus subsp. venerealis cfvB10]AIR81016.1 30S ribosomal protein S1 [Campylobacter fetus subsp. venerealis 97/608]PHJ03817.1 30S ribosomal protein S1 [Campylobacter fetus subsp. venerealis]PHJ06877.1 30S ribosomal protein S1 [Campylobacter fetus subsp. venerealis]QMS62445.1 30S ribosomal protein S1 [Campylobacter fetus]